MILSFGGRLVLLSAAAFFLVHLVTAALAAWLAPSAMRWANRMTPRRGTHFLLTIRFAPVILSVWLVGAVVVPGYLRFEPKDTVEEGGAACWIAAALGTAIWAIAISRSWRAVIRSRRYAREWARRGAQTLLPGEAAPVRLVESRQPILALTGILHPEVVVSRGVLASLPPHLLAAALSHERAHHQAHDNLKRLLLLLAPGILPGWRGFDALERAWGRLAEWAADDYAVAESPSRSVLLADAMVSVARLGSPVAPSLATSFSDGSLDLAARVDRLLTSEAAPQAHHRKAGWFLIPLTVALAFGAARPEVLLSVHRWLERLMD